MKQIGRRYQQVNVSLTPMSLVSVVLNVSQKMVKPYRLIKTRHSRNLKNTVLASDIALGKGTQTETVYTPDNNVVITHTYEESKVKLSNILLMKMAATKQIPQQVKNQQVKRLP